MRSSERAGALRPTKWRCIASKAITPNPPAPSPTATSRSSGWRQLARFCIVLLTGTALTQADQGWDGQSLHLTWENDATRGADRHYTQGAKLLYLSRDNATPLWLDRLSDLLPRLGLEPAVRKWGAGAGQEIYTPANLNAREVVKGDQPYAGWLYVSALLERRGTGLGSVPAMEHFTVDLGIVGPESQAEDTQRVWHDRDPQGWRNQLHTEPGFDLRYDRQYLLRKSTANGWMADVIPDLSGSLGNVDIHLGLGALTRLGYRIPNRFESEPSPARGSFGAYAFGRLGGRWVIRNLFLDGNTWRDSHHVESEAWVGEASVGLAVVWGPVELAAANNYRTREFVGQHHADSFGSATLTFKF